MIKFIIKTKYKCIQCSKWIYGKENIYYGVGFIYHKKCHKVFDKIPTKCRKCGIDTQRQYTVDSYQCYTCYKIQVNKLYFRD